MCGQIAAEIIQVLFSKFLFKTSYLLLRTDITSLESPWKDNSTWNEWFLGIQSRSSWHVVLTAIINSQESWHATLGCHHCHQNCHHCVNNFSRLRKVWVVVGLSTFHWRLWQKLSQEREKGGKYNCTNSSEERLQKQKIGEIQLKIHPIYFPLNSDKTDLKLNIKSLWRVMQYKYKEFIKRNTPTCCGSKVQTRDAFWNLVEHFALECAKVENLLIMIWLASTFEYTYLRMGSYDHSTLWSPSINQLVQHLPRTPAWITPSLFTDT